MNEQGQGTRALTDAMSRREFVAGTLAGGAALALPGALPWPTAAQAATAASCAPSAFRTSLSVMTPFSEGVLAQAAITDGEVTARTLSELQRLYERHGATEVYNRISTKKAAGSLARARLAHDLGLPYNPELGLFGTYGDAATYQDSPDFSDYPSIKLPGSWIMLTIDQMVGPMRQYGALAAREILATGAHVNYWDLGNEVENGIAGVAVYPLFPTTNYRPPINVDPLIGTMSVPTLIAMSEDERIAWCKQHLWPYIGRLLSAAADGIRSVVPNAKFSTHISDFGQRTPAVQLAFWETVKAEGYLPDLFGTSYYPTDGRTDLGAADRPAWLKGIATELHKRYGRQMFIAEYAYPSALMQPPYPFNDTVTGYPQTPAGQHAFTRDLVAWGVESGLLAGIRPWAPDFCNNSGWEPMSWFTLSGSTATAKPALHAIQEALATHAGCAIAEVRLVSPDGQAPGRAMPQSHQIGSPDEGVSRAAQRLVSQFYGRRHRRHGVLVRLTTTNGTLSRLTVELRRGAHILARASVARVGKAGREIVLHPSKPLPRGRYQLVVLRGATRIVSRTVRLG